MRLPPLVISFDDVPDHVDEEVARSIPTLAVLAALAHPTVETVTAALQVILPLPPQQSELYSDAIMEMLSDADRLLLESRMIKNYEYKTNWVRNYLAPSNQKAREEGRQEGREEGRKALLAVALELARTKLGQLPERDEAAIRALHDEARLTALALALGQAGNTEQARAAIDQALAA